MTQPTRENVALAILSVLAPLGPTGNNTFLSVARGAAQAQDIGKGLQPALRLFKPPGIAEKWSPGTKIPAVRTWEYGLLIYCRSDKSTVWETVANPLIEAVEGILAPDNVAENRLSLGGLVWDCRLDGEALVGQGDIDADSQGVVWLPLIVIVP